MKKRTSSRPFVLVVFLLVASLFLTALADPLTCEAPSANKTYEWEDQDHYQILGLVPPTQKSRKKQHKKRRNIQPAEIKKAYRKQAQLYHPDKHSKNTTLSTEESTARFAKIAEAYETLRDKEKRQEYDAFLVDCEEYLSQRQENDGPWSSVFDFFGSKNEESNTWDYDRSSRDRSTNNDRRDRPVRVYESREVHYDAYSGQQVMRVLQTEEFATDSKGRFFYRVTGQDFVEQYDYFHGMTYVPVTPSFLVEEGYKQEQTHTRKSNTLMAGDFLLAQSSVLTSANGHYYVGISADCELLIMTDAWEEDTVVWSSETHVPFGGACFLGLRGPHLVLAMGTPDRPGQILWHSNVPDAVVEQEEELLAMGGIPSRFVARLDDDGSLAVYRQGTVSPRTEWWDRLFPNEPQTRAARAWLHLLTWARRRLSRRGECIYATGPVGCNRPGRMILHLGKGVSHSVKHTVGKIDNAIDALVESWDDDEDIVDTIFRVANKASHGLLRAGQSLFRIQARLLHTFFTRVLEHLNQSR